MADIYFSEGSGLNDSVFGKSQTPIRAMIEKRAEAWEQSSIHDKIFNIEKSDNYAEKLTSMTGLGDFQPVGEAGAYPVTGMQEGYSKILEHKTWKQSFAVTQEMMEDNKMLELRKSGEKFVSSYYRTREKFGAGLLFSAIGADSMTFGDYSFPTLCADGQRLFAATHPLKTKATITQSNIYSNALSAENIGLVAAAMQDYRDDNNELVSVSPDTIVVPNSAKMINAAFEAIGSDKDPATGNNAFNYQYGRWNVLVWPYLNQWDTLGTNPWFLLDSNYNKMYGSLVWFDRIPLSVKSYVDDSNDNNIWNGRCRFIAGFNDWRGIACAGITGGTTLA